MDKSNTNIKGDYLLSKSHQASQKRRSVIGSYDQFSKSATFKKALK